ncbi:hypothetical protein NDU88_003358 [Pleurodeles waltl]|uniref:Uncharacterized protein n=1 Tax=Pleurodeles waltl TaxID=8319 RepID=A0AAV7P9A9_PLEWA|nr:hypothetical protein NDU88_003358 [Pleurodeles waltl]
MAISSGFTSRRLGELFSLNLLIALEAWREARGSFETHGEVTLDYVCLGKIKARLSRRCGLLAEQLDTLLKQEHTLIERLIGRNTLKRYLWKNFETNTNRQVSF